MTTQQPVPSGTYNHGMDTRERLLDATEQLLWERGYAATSPKDILVAAHAGQGSMYHHFSGKQELAVEALVHSTGQLRAEAAGALQAPGTALDRVEQYLRRQRDSLRGCRVGRMTYDPDVLATPTLLQPVADTLEWLVAELERVIEEGIAAGEFPGTVDARQLAFTVAAVVQGGYVLARAGQDASAFDAAVEGAIGLLRGIAA